MVIKNGSRVNSRHIIKDEEGEQQEEQRDFEEAVEPLVGHKLSVIS
jgi:hypothetical protein